MAELLWKLTLLVVVAALCLLGAGAVAWVVYMWFHGVCQSALLLWGWPEWATVVIVLLILWLVRPGALVLAIFGFIGTVWWLKWPWYGSLALYLPTIAFLFASFFSVVIVGLFAGLAQLVSKIRQ